jgi:ribosome assembly protein YihI (activator of Der GTPase)
MKIKTKNQYNSVLKEIDVLLELSFLDNFQTNKLKKLLDALDEYQTIIHEDQRDVSAELAKDFILKHSYKFN